LALFVLQGGLVLPVNRPLRFRQLRHLLDPAAAFWSQQRRLRLMMKKGRLADVLRN
jgi:hypothetical protein